MYHLHFLIKDARFVFKKDELGMEIFRIAVPTALAFIADPVASLIDTVFIGRIGPVELAAVGVSIAVFNQISKIAIFPLVSVTTSFVAEEDTARRVVEVQENDNHMELEELITKSEMEGNSQRGNLESNKRHLSSASSALVFGGVLGVLQAIFLILGAKPILNIMGVKSDSPMLTPAREYLILRSLGSPAILLNLAMQGIFRGFKDTKTPLYATVVGDVANVILDPVLMFVFHLGVGGAAIAHIISQYLSSLILLLALMKRIDLLPESIMDLQFARFLKSGSLLLARVVAVTICVTLAASMAARHGAITMAAFQICLQIWMTTSLLNDGLAVAGQAILASAFAERDHGKAMATASRVLQLAFVMGLVLSAVVAVGLHLGSTLFTNDTNVLNLITIGIPFVAVTQPINALSFVLDGVNFGASDFTYAACSTVAVAILSIPCLFTLSNSHGFVGIWIALTIYMSMRTFVGFGRIGTGSGPWGILRCYNPL